MIDKLRVAETFVSIQGEGKWSGVPSTFFRVSGCNLRCTWCDTPYASWHPEGEVFGAEEICDRLFPLSTEHLVITGGEPMLFDGIETIAVEAKKRGHITTVETAGTVFRELPCNLMSISPKLSNSTPEGEWRERHENARLNFSVLTALTERYPFQLKFVVNPEAGGDVQEILEILGGLANVCASDVLLMPEGRDSETLWRRARLLAPICIERGWRLAPRMQIDLFGDRRGT